MLIRGLLAVKEFDLHYKHSVSLKAEMGSQSVIRH